MTRHQLPELLRQASDLTLPVSPPPSRFLRHADTIDPIAEAYADLFQARYGFPVQVGALERFLEFDLQLPYGWQDIPEPDMKAHADIIDAIETGQPAKADAAVRRFMAPVIAALERMILS